MAEATAEPKIELNTICNSLLRLHLISGRNHPTWLPQLDTEVVSHRSVGVRCDGIVAMLPRPLDQGL